MGLDYVELPDLSLSALQKRFTLPSELEELYQRYEQRFQVGECYYFPFLFFLGAFPCSLNYEPTIFFCCSTELKYLIMWGRSVRMAYFVGLLLFPLFQRVLLLLAN